MKDFSLRTKAYLFSTMAAGIFFLAWHLRAWDFGPPVMTAALSLVASLSLIFKVEGATNRSHYNISFLIYSFSFILLGAPATMLVILVSNLVEWAWHRYPWYIQCFNITSYFVVLEFTNRIHSWIASGTAPYSWTGVLAILVAMATFTLFNHLMIGIIVWLARGENLSQSGIFNLFPLMLDFILLCMGAGAALLWMFNPAAIILTLLPLYLIYSTLKVPALERKSETDAKTGLFNAEYFKRALENELNRANRFDRPLTVVIADLDLLRNINNTYGHLAGDEVIIGIARILKTSMRDYDLVSRFGGEEFALLIPEATPEDVYDRIEAVRNLIEKNEFTVPTSVTPIRVTMSFGVAGREGFSQTVNQIIHNADSALYYSKLKGRNRTYIYSKDTLSGLFPNQENEALHGPERKPDIVQGPSTVEASSKPLSEKPGAEPPAAQAAPAVQGDEDKYSEAKQEAEPQAPQPTTGAFTKMLNQGRVGLIIGGMALVSLLLFGLLLRMPIRMDWFGLVVFNLIVILTEWMSIDLYVRDSSVSTSAAPMLAGFLLFGPVGALVMSVSFALVAMIKHNSRFSRLAFNTSNQLFAGLLCIGMVQATGFSFTSWPLQIQLVLALLSAAIVYVCTTGFVAVMMHQTLGEPVQKIWEEKFSWLAPYYMAMGLIAFALILSYQFGGIFGTIVILVPLLLLRFSQKQYIDRTRTVVKELRENNLLLEKNSQEISTLNDNLFETLAEVIDLRDPYVLGHSKQVCHYAVLVARQLGLPDKQVELIRKASLLHDIGKLGIPDSILLKPASLTADEFEVIKRHPGMGADILLTSRALRNLTPCVRHHHEHFNGHGYPDGLQGNQIPLEARIVGLADAVEAMASDRPYRAALDLPTIIAEVKRCSGAQFDPMVVKAFLDTMEAGQAAQVINVSRGVRVDLGLSQTSAQPN